MKNGIHERSADTGIDISDSLDLRDYFRAVYDHKWSITLFVALVVSCATYYAQRVTPVFRSTATVLIEPQRSGNVPYGESEDPARKSDGYLQTRVETLRSRGLAKTVVEQLDLINHPEYQPEQNTFLKRFLSDSEAQPTSIGRAHEVIEKFQSKVSVRSVEETNLVRVTVESVDSELAALAANSLVEQLIANDLEQRRRVTDNSSDWLSERLATLEKKLNESEQALLQFKKDNQLFDVRGEVQRLDDQELLLATSELAEARINLANTETLYREVRASRDDPDQLESLSVVQADAGYNQTLSELNRLRREISTMSNRYGPKNPRLTDANTQADSLENSLKRIIDRVIASVEKDYDLKRRRVAELERKLTVEKQSAQEFGSRTIELDVLEREVAADRQVYDTFLNKIAEIRSARGLESVNAQVMDVAVPANRPFKPRKKVIVLLAAIGSLMLSMLVVLIRKQIDDTVDKPQDVERLLGVSLLGMQPLLKSKESKRGGNQVPLDAAKLAAGQESTAFLEAARTIRTNLKLIDTDRASQVIVLTSSTPGEGKSTTAINLARTFAIEERVVLIDGDLRRPTLARLVRLDPTTLGLTDLLRGDTNLSDCVRQGKLGNLDIICSGRPTDQPIELLESVGFSTLLSVLRKHYDRIIIDCAPIHAVSDPLVVSKHADAVVYIIKWHATKVQLARQGLDKLRKIGARIIGAVVTQVDVTKAGRLVSYEYQGYYDHYGYGSRGQVDRDRAQRSRDSGYSVDAVSTLESSTRSIRTRQG